MVASGNNQILVDKLKSQIEENTSDEVDKLRIEIEKQKAIITARE